MRVRCSATLPRPHGDCLFQDLLERVRAVRARGRGLKSGMHPTGKAIRRVAARGRIPIGDRSNVVRLHDAVGIRLRRTPLPLRVKAPNPWRSQRALGRARLKAARHSDRPCASSHERADRLAPRHVRRGCGADALRRLTADRARRLIHGTVAGSRNARRCTSGDPAGVTRAA